MYQAIGRGPPRRDQGMAASFLIALTLHGGIFYLGWKCRPIFTPPHIAVQNRQANELPDSQIEMSTVPVSIREVVLPAMPGRQIVKLPDLLDVVPDPDRAWVAGPAKTLGLETDEQSFPRLGFSRLVQRAVPATPRVRDLLHHPAVPHDVPAGEVPTPSAGNPPPIYPPEALRRRLQGTVLLKIDIGREGTVRGISIVTSSGYKMLDLAAMDSVRDWKFKPATAGGVATDCQVELPIRFVLKA